MSVTIRAISELFDVGNETQLTQAINLSADDKFEAVSSNQFDNWTEVIAFVHHSEGEGIVVSAMFVPLRCYQELDSVIGKYSEEINELTQKYRAMVSPDMPAR